MRDNQELAEWLNEVHDTVKLSCFEAWPDIVAEQKPLIEKLMAQANTTNPLAAVVPVVKDIPRGDGSKCLLLAVAAEMIMRNRK